jgi:peroxiredoxin
VEVIGIALDLDPQPVAKFARRLGVSYTILLGDSDVMQKWKIAGIPTTFVIDRSGIILKQVVGFEYTEVFEKALEEAL